MEMSAPKLHLYNHLMVSLPLFFLLLISQFFNLAHSCHPHDKDVLLRIKNHFGNPFSLGLWDTNSDCCHWQNIQCNEQGRVTSLGIQAAHDIHAPFPTFLDKLPSLTELYFQDVPKLSGSIPSSIGKLTNLTLLIIYETNMAGPIPDFLGRLTKLTRLELSFNKFTGPIPLALAKLTGLTSLNLGSNKLSGKIPGLLIERLRSLDSLILKSNHLSGLIPETLGQYLDLTYLDLSGNQFTGPIPQSLGLANVMTLRLSQNKFTGDASFLFEKANTAISNIYVDNNLLKFDFSNVDLPRRLVGFNVSHNMIYGSLPKRFGEMWVDSVDVSYNQLCGPIPNGRRFKRVDPIIFSHNKCLCGGPLHACK